MAEHKKSPHDGKRSAGWTTGVKLGTRLLVFDDGEAIQLLKAAVESEGTQEAFAKRHRIQRSNLNRILSGKKPVNSVVLKALGLRKVYARQSGSMKMHRRKRSEIPGYWVSRSQSLGTQAHNVFDDNDALVLLKAAIERAGSQAAFADRHGIHRTYISMILSGRYHVTQSIIKALGLRKVYVEQGSHQAEPGEVLKKLRGK
jgi:DNA-binding transcriptional regulator YdaS (Cro superfamily)